jgi:hypothetical protein
METRTHRRAVLATGAKLAYAVPIIAASARLTSGRVAAVSVSCPAGCPAVAHLADGSDICTSRIVPLDSLVVCCDAATPCTGRNDHDCVRSSTDLATGEVTPKVCPTNSSQGLCQTVTPCA